MKIPRVSGDEAIRALERLGSVQVRQRGSHVVMRKTEAGSAVGCVVPRHPELAPGTLRGIIKQAKVPIELFVEKLK